MMKLFPFFRSLAISANHTLRNKYLGLLIGLLQQANDILLHEVWLPELSKLDKARLDQLKIEIHMLRALLQEMEARVTEVQQSYNRYTDGRMEH